MVRRNVVPKGAIHEQDIIRGSINHAFRIVDAPASSGNRFLRLPGMYSSSDHFQFRDAEGTKGLSKWKQSSGSKRVRSLGADRGNGPRRSTVAGRLIVQ